MKAFSSSQILFVFLFRHGLSREFVQCHSVTASRRIKKRSKHSALLALLDFYSLLSLPFYNSLRRAVTSLTHDVRQFLFIMLMFHSSPCAPEKRRNLVLNDFHKVNSTAEITLDLDADESRITSQQIRKYLEALKALKALRESFSY